MLLENSYDRKITVSHAQLLCLSPNESTLALLSICVFILPLTCFLQNFTSAFTREVGYIFYPLSPKKPLAVFILLLVLV